MHSKLLFKRSLLVIVPLGVLVFSLVGFYSKVTGSIQYNKTPLGIAATTPLATQLKPTLYSFPKRLVIPVLQVDSVIESVVIASNGEMGTTTDPNHVAWYKPGVRPGEIGSAVIAGHSGWKNNKMAAFDSLKKLHSGDTLYVNDEAGATITFVVRTFKEYAPADDAQSIFTASDGTAHLNLITCEGAWSVTSHSYSKRLVVFTDKQ